MLLFRNSFTILFFITREACQGFLTPSFHPLLLYPHCHLTSLSHSSTLLSPTLQPFSPVTYISSGSLHPPLFLFSHFSFMPLSPCIISIISPLYVYVYLSICVCVYVCLSLSLSVFDSLSNFIYLIASLSISLPFQSFFHPLLSYTCCRIRGGHDEPKLWTNHFL